MLPEPVVTVVVPVLNGADTIGDLLTALAHQANPPRDTEIIVVDNGSTDGTRDIVRRFPVIHLDEATRGASAARNCGLSRALGDVVVFLDADTLPTRRWLAEIIAPFADPSIILVGGRSVDYRSTTAAERFVTQLGPRRLEYDFFRRRLPYVAAENMAIRRAALLAVGGWDESFITAEDLDLCVRLVRRYACPIVRQPDAVLFTRRRRTFDALLRQAWDYGQGLGLAHLRYPDIIRLNPVRWLVLGWTLAVRRSKAWIVPAGHRLGLTSAAQAEFARHHWDWSKRFWGGFVSMVRHHTWRVP